MKNNKKLEKFLMMALFFLVKHLELKVQLLENCVLTQG